MTNNEKAQIILEALEEYIQVDYNFEQFYLKAIKNGLEKIRKMEVDYEKEESLI